MVKGGASEHGRQRAQLLARVFGGTPSVNRFYDEDESHAVDILEAKDRPVAGRTSWSTLTLSESPNLLDGRDIRVEVAGIAPNDAEGFANALATASFNVVKDRWLCAPGVVFPDLLQMYDVSSRFPHVMWWEPIPWPDLASVQGVADVDVHWLVAVPLAEAERRFLTESGASALEERLTSSRQDWLDLERDVVI